MWLHSFMQNSFCIGCLSFQHFFFLQRIQLKFFTYLFILKCLGCAQKIILRFTLLLDVSTVCLDRPFLLILSECSSFSYILFIDLYSVLLKRKCVWRISSGNFYFRAFEFYFIPNLFSFYTQKWIRKPKAGTNLTRKVYTGYR